jgi:predicted O-methyltransferase YrrM
MSQTTWHDLIQKIERFGSSNDVSQPAYSDKMLNLERPTAELVDILIRSSNRRSILEIGTSNGYSTLWLARALLDTGGHLHTIESDESKYKLAAQNIEQAGLSSLVTQHFGDATTIVPTLHQSFDCVFFDADRLSSPEQLSILLPDLAPDVLLLTDNATSHASQLEGYVAAVQQLPDFHITTVPVGKGLHIAHRRASR